MGGRTLTNVSCLYDARMQLNNSSQRNLQSRRRPSLNRHRGRGSGVVCAGFTNKYAPTRGRSAQGERAPYGSERPYTGVKEQHGSESGP